MTAPARLFVAPGQGQLLTFKGTERRMKATSHDTEGHLTAFESTYPAEVPHPLHIHHDAIESWYILEGTCRFHIGRCVRQMPRATFMSFPGLNHLEAFYQAPVVLPPVVKFLRSLA